MAFTSTMIGESSYDIISHMTSMENRLMFKFGDVLEAQEMLHVNYLDLTNIVKDIAAKLSLPFPEIMHNVALRKSKSAHSIRSDQSMMARLGELRSNSAKLPLLAIKRARSKSPPAAQYQKLSAPVKSDIIEQNLARLHAEAHEQASASPQVPDAPAPPAPASQAPPARASESETADGGAAAAETSGAWFKRMVTIKDSSEMFHKDFKAARSHHAHDITSMYASTCVWMCGSACINT
jgi:hypothetical protein